jgi:precorrin isomerase
MNTTAIKSRAFSGASSVASAIKARSPISFSVSTIRTDTVEGIMKPLTKPIDDLDTLIDNKEFRIAALYTENERLRYQIEANLDRIQQARDEIGKATTAMYKLRAVLG